MNKNQYRSMHIRPLWDLAFTPVRVKSGVRVQWYLKIGAIM